jgi:endo-alpha-N-acetylgalactosaminidase
VNKIALGLALEDADTRLQADYTVKSWTRFLVAVSTAQTVYGYPVASQREVNAALDDLNIALGSLHPAHLCDEFEDLEALIEAAEELNEADYTAASWADFAEALLHAIDMRDYCRDGSGTWDMKDEALETLQEAIDALVEV